MFALKKNTKEVEDKRANLPLGKKERKQGKMLEKGVKKFLRYNDDLLTDEQKEVIREKQQAFSDSLQDESLVRKDVEKTAKELTDQCESSVKSHRPSVMKENIEVIFVAVVIAMGIRAYFIQQFKIPTGSMQPTLVEVTWSGFLKRTITFSSTKIISTTKRISSFSREPI